MSLVGILRVGIPEVGLGQQRGQLRSFWRRPDVIGRDGSLFLRRSPLGRHSDGYKEKEGQAQSATDEFAVAEMDDHRVPQCAVNCTLQAGLQETPRKWLCPSERPGSIQRGTRRAVLYTIRCKCRPPAIRCCEIKLCEIKLPCKVRCKVRLLIRQSHRK